VEVAIGVDSHKGSLAAAAVDGVGRVLEAREFPNHPRGHGEFEAWVRAQGADRRIGVEGSLNYGAALTKRLLSCGEDVREVPASLTHAERRKRRSEGKSDLVDAVAIARVVARDEDLPSARRSAKLSDLKLLVDYRDQLVRARTQVANRVHADLAAIRPGYERGVRSLQTTGQLATARSLLRGDHSVRAELLRRRVAELTRLDRNIAAAGEQIALMVAGAGTTLTEIPGVGPLIAAKILGEVGEVSRIRSKAAFAALSGAAPLIASSGQTNRHRLNRGGNRQLNWALHFIAFIQSRSHPPAKAYLARQREAGKSSKEAMRCLKRHLSNVVYRCLVADARRTETTV
jgi:transposase